MSALRQDFRDWQERERTFSFVVLADMALGLILVVARASAGRWGDAFTYLGITCLWGLYVGAQCEVSRALRNRITFTNCTFGPYRTGGDR